MAGSLGRVLVVDDDEVIRRLISVNLELEGFETVTAQDGVECLERIGAVRPAVVTLDVYMPRLDGLRTAARLRGDPRTAGVKIVMISADGAEGERRGAGAGADAYLAKPFDPAELVRTVRRLAGVPGGDGEGGAPGHGGTQGGVPGQGGTQGGAPGQGGAAEQEP